VFEYLEKKLLGIHIMNEWINLRKQIVISKVNVRVHLNLLLLLFFSNVLVEDIYSQAKVVTEVGHTSKIRKIAFTDNDHFITIAENSVKLWDANLFKELANTIPYGDEYSEYCSIARKIMSPRKDLDSIFVYNVDTWELEDRVPIGSMKDMRTYLWFSPDARFIVKLFLTEKNMIPKDQLKWKGKVLIYDRNQKSTKDFTIDNTYPEQIQFSSNGNSMLIRGYRTYYLYSFKSNKLKGKWSTSKGKDKDIMHSPYFSKDGNYIAVLGNKESRRVINSENGKVVKNLEVSSLDLDRSSDKVYFNNNVEYYIGAQEITIYKEGTKEEVDYPIKLISMTGYTHAMSPNSDMIIIAGDTDNVHRIGWNIAIFKFDTKKQTITQVLDSKKDFVSYSHIANLSLSKNEFYHENSQGNFYSHDLATMRLLSNTDKPNPADFQKKY
jgi:hypothetical protein